MNAEEFGRIIRESTTPEYALEVVLAHLRVSAGQAAADLLAAANAHDAAHGSTDSFVMAAFDAVEALSDIATHGVGYEDVLPPPGGER